MTYDSNSQDALFSRILTRLDQQDNTLATILAEVRKTNGRVTKIETERAVERGKLAVIAALISGAVGVAGWAISTFLK